MANYTALVDVKVDVGRANKAFKNIEGSLLRVSKATKGTNKFLGQMEKTFGGIQKSMLISAQAGRSTVRQLKQLSGAAKTSAADVEKLKKQVKTLQTELDKLNGKAGKVMPIFRKLGKMYKEHSFLIQSMTSAFFGFIQYQLIGGLRRMTDQFVLMSNRVRIVNQDVRVFNINMQNAFKIAQETRQPLFTVANTLARIGRNSAKLRTDFTRLARITSTIGKSFQIAGATIEEANNAMIQLSQAFASGRLQGDELRSVLELAPRLAQAIASSIGITVGQMRQFAKEGKLTTKVLEAAIVEASATVDKEFGTIQKTIGQALTQVNNSLTMVVGSVDRVTKTNKAFADAFTRISKAIDQLGRSRGALQVANFLKSIADNLESILVVGSSLLATGVLAGLAVGFAAIALSLGKVSMVITAVSALVVGLGVAFTDFGTLAKPVFEEVTGSNAEQLAILKTQIVSAREFIAQESKKLAELDSYGLKDFFGGQRYRDNKKNIKSRLEEEIENVQKTLNRLLLDQVNIEQRITKEKEKQAQTARDLFLAEGARKASGAQQLATQQGIGAEQIRQFRMANPAGSNPLGARILGERVQAGQEVRKAVVDVLQTQFGITLPQNKRTSSLLRGIIGDDNQISTKNLDALMGAARGAFFTSHYGSRSLARETVATTLAHGGTLDDLPGSSLPGAARSEITARTAGTMQTFQDNVKDAQLEYEDSLLRAERSQMAQTRSLGMRSAILQEQLGESLHIFELNKLSLAKTIELKQAEAEKVFLQQENKSSVDSLTPIQQLHLGLLKEEIKLQEDLTNEIKEQGKLLGLRNQTRSMEKELIIRQNFGSQLRNQDPVSAGFNRSIMQIASEFDISISTLKVRTDELAGSQRNVIDIDEELLRTKIKDKEVLDQIIEKRKQAELGADIEQAKGGGPMSGEGLMGRAAGAAGEHGQRAAKATAAYYSGGGGLTGLINALIELILGNKKVMEALFKILGDFMEVIDEAFTPIGELLLDVMGGLKPLMSILKQIMRPFGKMFLTLMKVMEPLTGFIEQLQPLFFMMEAVMMGILALVDFIMQLVGQAISGILQGFGISQKDEGYKSAALLSSEERILSDIEKVIEKTAEHLEKINDVIFDIEQSTLNLAAPAVKLEDSAAKYDELFEAATRTDATEEAVDAYTAYAKEFLQQSQDIFKSSAAYQDIYDTVLADLNSLNTTYVNEASDTLTKAFQEAIFDLDLVGSDLGEVFTNIVDDFNAGIITLADAQSFLTSKQEQIAYDLSLYDYGEQTDVSVKNIGDMAKLYNMRMSQHNQSQGRATSSMEGKIGKVDGKVLRGYETELASGGGGVDSGIYNRVLQAALLIMNPEHYAVSVRRNSDGSLEVIDRATDAGALSMMAAANAAGVPVVVDPATARALYAGKTSDLSNLNIGSSPTTVGTSSGKLQIGSVERVAFEREEKSNPLDDLLGRLPDLGGSLAGLAQAILDGFMEALKALGAGVQDILNAVFGFIGDAFKGAGDVVGQIMSAIMGPIATAMGKAGNLVSQFLGGILEPIGKIIVGIPDFLAGLFYPISGIAVNVMDFLRGIFKPIFDMGGINIGAFFQQLFDLIFSGQGLDLASVAQQILGAAIDFGGQAMNGLNEVWKKVSGAISDFFDFDNAFNAVSDLIVRAGTAIAGFFNLDVPKGGIKLLKNPFEPYGLGPEYFINWSWEEGGQLPEKFASGGMASYTKALVKGPGVARHSSLDGSGGGMAKGKSHLGGGMPGVIRTSGQPIEFEGGEYIVNKNSVGHLGTGILEHLNNVSTVGEANKIRNTIASTLHGNLGKSTNNGKSIPDPYGTFGVGGLTNIDGEGYDKAKQRASGTIDGNTPGFPKTLFETRLSTADWPWPFSQLGNHGLEAKFQMKNAASVGDSYFRVFANGGSLNFGQNNKQTMDSAINSFYYGRHLGANATATKDAQRTTIYDGRPDVPLLGKGTEVTGENCTYVENPFSCCDPKMCGPWWAKFQCGCDGFCKNKVCTPTVRNYYHDVEMWADKLLPNRDSAEGMNGKDFSSTITDAFKLVIASASGFYPYWPGAKAEKGYYARGGMIHGPSHAKGGVPIYAEGGEFVVNKNATRRHRGLLSRINSFQDGGSLTFNPSDYFGVRTTENTPEEAGFLSSVYSAGSTDSTAQLGNLTLTNSVTAQNTGASTALLQTISDTQYLHFDALSALIRGQSYNTEVQLRNAELIRVLIGDLTDQVMAKFDAGWAIVNQGIEFLRQQIGRDGRANDRYYMNLSAENGRNLRGIEGVHRTVGEGQAWNLADMYNNTRYAPANNAVLYDIKETVDHMRRQTDKPGGRGILQGIGGTIGGDVGKVITSVGNIFSDRGVKTFRGGGMTESQQTDMLRKVQPQTFRYKSGGPVQTGFMAQDLQKSSFGRQFVHDSPVGKYVDGGIIGPLLASQSIMQSRMDSYQMGGQIASDSGMSEALLQGIIDAIRDQDMNVNVYTNTEDEVGQMMSSSNSSSAEAGYRDVVNYA